MPRPKKFRNGAIEFCEDDRGFYYLRIFEGEDVSEEDLSSLMTWVQSETSAASKPMLIELSYGSTISPSVQKHFASDVERFSSADAILISTFAHKLMATFYLRHYKPLRPTRVFNDVFDALEWIEEMRHADHTAES